MNLSCNVTRDLLPLYHDGVCSPESCALIEDHLKTCPACAAVLGELRGEIVLDHDMPNDAELLKSLEKSVNKGKKQAWLKGAAAVLAMVLLACIGRYAWWYTDTRVFYEKYAEGHEPRFGTSVYQWTDGNYLFRVDVPEKPGDGGSRFVELIREENTFNVIPGQEIDVWLNFGKDEVYVYLVGLEVCTRTQIPGEPRLKTEVWTEYLMLDQNLNLLYADYMDEEDRARQDQIFVDYNWEIMEIIEAARTEWPFLTEE